MNTRRIAFALALISTAIGPRLFAATERLAPPAACEAVENRSLLKVDRGLVLCYRRWTEASDDRPNVFVFDKNGRQTAARRVYFEPAVKVEVNDVAAEAGGGFVAVGMAATGDGRMTGFVARVAADGTVVTARLNEAIPDRVCAAGDRTVWAMVEPAPGAGGDGGRLVHIGVNGSALGAFLPRSRFHSEGEPAMHANEGSPGLFCGASGVSVYVAASGDWFEVGGDGSVLRSERVARVPFVWQSRNPHVLQWAQVYGYAATGNGEVYASFQDERGPMLYRLDVAAAAWVPATASTTAEGKTLARLAGSDGGELVYEVSYHDGSLPGLAWGQAN